MKLIPRIGAGPLRLGMSREDVEGLLGAPDHREVEEALDDEATESWEYETHGLELTFDEDHAWRLSSLTMTTPDLLGVAPVGLTEEDALVALEEAGVPPFKLDEEFDDVDARNYECDEWDLAMWVSEGYVASLTVFPQYDAKGEMPRWPKAETEVDLP